MSSVDVDLKYIPICDVPNCLPKKNGKKVSVSAVYRWLKGLRGVRLKAAQIGGTRCTTSDWLSEFFSALSEQAGLASSVPAAEQPAERQAEIARSSARVKALVK